MSAKLEADLRSLARSAYVKTRIGRPHMPPPDSAEGQRKIDRLFNILWAEAGRRALAQAAGGHDAE